ncbi:general substrate transporter [Coemansia spiralis]|uniref:Bifunctional purine biosynthesis protein PurH n=1 Tax=Coemansia umbellata TaxID=1424467 RepID=A0ABQ8PKB5_9FUNG|nr:general substrate transporter [Coemansia spiralis]KAJ1989428.1 Bifunctional purine biosynthesis protein PurH [Coemansia umbellata]
MAIKLTTATLLAKDSQSLGITKFQLLCVLASSIATINYGWNLAVTNLPGDIITQCLAGPRHEIGGLPSCMPTTSFIWGVAIGSYAVGALIGALASTWFSNNFGRKFVLMYFNVIGLAATLLLALPVNIPMFVVGRIIAGVAQGAANGTFSSYVVEITTPRARSSLASMTQMAVVFGQMIALIIALGMLKPPLWRILFSLTGALCLISMALMHFCVESPKWLATKGRLDEAQVALQKLREGADITDEYAQLLETTKKSTDMKQDYTASVLDVILGRTPENLRHQLLVAVMVMFFQQASGISAISFYSTTLFGTISPTQDVDRDISKPNLAQILSVVLTIIGAFSTLVGMFVANYLGRRTLMLASHGLMAIFCVLISVGSIVDIPIMAIVMVFFYFFSYFFGPGPLPWVIPNEMTPTYAITAIMAINNCIGYLGTFVVGLIFSPMLSAMNGYTFLIFAGLNALAFVCFFFFLPETKDRLIADMVKVHSVGIHNVLQSKYRVNAYINRRNNRIDPIGQTC